MAKNVLPKHWNGSEFEELHIVTKASNVFTNDNKSVQQKIDDFTSHLAECAVLIPQAGSTANAILLDIVLTDKKKGSFKASSNNTGNMTINGKPFKKDATTEIPVDGVKAGRVYDFYYDQTADCVFILAKASGTAQPSDVLAGKTFSNDDGEQVGTKDLSNLIPNNIKNGVIIDNIVGNVIPKVFAYGTVYLPSSGENITISSLTFKPRCVIAETTADSGYMNPCVAVRTFYDDTIITGRNTAWTNRTGPLVFSITTNGFVVRDVNGVGGNINWYAIGD